jgi:hypothetical protein
MAIQKSSRVPLRVLPVHPGLGSHRCCTVLYTYSTSANASLSTLASLIPA